MPIDPSNTYGGRKAVTPLLKVAPVPTIPRAPTQRAPTNYYAGATNMQSYADRMRAGGYNPMQPFGTQPLAQSAQRFFNPPPVAQPPTQSPAWNPEGIAGFVRPEYSNPAWNPEGIAGFNDPTYLPIVEAPLPTQSFGFGSGSWGGGGGGGSRKAALNVGLVNWRI